MKNILFVTIIIILFFIGAFFFLEKSEETPQETAQGEEQSVSGEEKSTLRQSPSEEEIEAVLEKDAILATIKTEKGDIVLELYPKVAPKTVANFIKLAKDGFYNGTKFHRVISDFMIQGGDPLSKTDDPRVGTGGPGYDFEDEINPRALKLPEGYIKQLEGQGYKYDYSLASMNVKVGTVAMANSGPNTNGSQFFIVTQRDQGHLDGKHTVFGKVVEGMEAVRSIEQGDEILDLNTN